MEGDYQSAQLMLDALTFLFDRWEFLLGLIFGGGGGSYFTYRVTTEKKNTVSIEQEGEGNQSTSVADSPNSPPLTAGGHAARQDGPNGIMLAMNDSPGGTMHVNVPRTAGAEEALSPNPVPVTPNITALDNGQTYILEKVQEVLAALNISSSFGDRYQLAISHLNNNSAQVCASAYHAAFRDVVRVFLERSTYDNEAPSTENLEAFEEAFEEIRIFLNNASHDTQALRASIRSFEDSLMILLGYL